MFQRLTEQEKLYIINEVISCLSELLFEDEKQVRDETIRDFCVHCGARIPPIYGEGTCVWCTPVNENKIKEQIRNAPVSPTEKIEGPVQI